MLGQTTQAQTSSKTSLKTRKKEKMPTKVFYNLDHMYNPKNNDPTSNIYVQANDMTRVKPDRSRGTLSTGKRPSRPVPSPPASSFLLCRARPRHAEH